MKVTVRPLINQSGTEIGVVLSADINYIPTATQKATLDRALRDYVHQQYYPNRAISLYNHDEADTVAIVAIKDINQLPQKEVKI